MMIATLRRNSKDFFISVIKLFHHITSLFSGIIPAFNTILLHIEKDLVTVVMTITGLLYFSQLSFYFPLLFLLISIIYILVYFWRHIPIELVSYIWFMINSGIFVLFLLGFYNVFFIGLPNPIHLQDLSDFSYWRYFALLFFTLLGFISYFFIITYPSDFGSSIVHILSFPYLKENVRIILSSWDYSLLGDFSIKLSDNLVSKKYLKLLFICHFFIFYITRIINLVLFCNFVFFTGDLRFNLYLLPISFCVWILSYFEYYFFLFFNGFIDELKKIICVKTDIPCNSSNLISCNLNDLSYEITPYGFSQGYIDGPTVFKIWLDYCNVIAYRTKYKTNLRILSILLLTITSICWLYIIIPDLNTIHSTYFAFLRRSFSSTQKLLAPRQAHHLKESFQNQHRTDTNDSHSPGHPVYGEWKKPAEFQAEGSLTHGSGSAKDPSYPLGYERMASKPTSAIPYDNIRNIPEEMIDRNRPLPNTDRFLNEAEIKARLDRLHPTTPPSSNPPAPSSNSPSSSSN